MIPINIFVVSMIIYGVVFAFFVSWIFSVWVEEMKFQAWFRFAHHPVFSISIWGSVNSWNTELVAFPWQRNYKEIIDEMV